jgi:hypothetical protein
MAASKHNITPSGVKFELHAYNRIHDVSGFLKDWKEVLLELKRDGNSGVYYQLTSPFEFVLDGYNIIREIFEQYGVMAEAFMYVYIRREDWVYGSEKYYDPHVFALDFSTYSRTDTVIEIDTRDTGLFDLIKARSKIIYDIPVSEIKEAKTWNFTRIEMENGIIFRCSAGFTTPFRVEQRGNVSIGVSNESEEIAVKDVVFINTVAEGVVKQYASDYDESFRFMWLNGEVSSRMATYEIKITGVAGNANYYKSLRLYVTNGRYTVAYYDISLRSGSVIDWNVSGQTVLAPEFGYYLLLQYDTGDSAGVGYPLELNIDGTIEVRYDGINRPEKVDIINPKALLQALVNRMTETDNVYKSDIEGINTDNQDLTMMTAAESIRGIAEAQVHTGYNSFRDWMRAFGYEPHTTEKSIVFRKRSNVFRSDLTAIELDIRDVADLREYIEEDYLYSGLKIGYERKNIENVNVRFEFNGKHDYSTNLTVFDNVLELISPYRADCYGIEFLAQERGKDTSDDKSDKDLFIINLRAGSSFYETKANDFSGNHPNGTLFNGNYNPYNLMRLNEDLIGVSVKRLTFTASDSNAKIIINNQPVNADHNIPDNAGLFSPVVYDIASRNVLNLPSGEKVNGIVRFRYLDKVKNEEVVYEGFIDEISKNIAWETETVWKLRKNGRRNS